MLEIKDLKIFEPKAPEAPLVKGISFKLACAKVALLGGSGSGKTLISRALLNVLAPNLRSSFHTFTYNNLDLLEFAPDDWLKLRGREIAMVLQDASTALNPLKTIEQQMLESYNLYYKISAKPARQAAFELLAQCGFAQPEQVLKQYPHQLSGGMAQRVLIAMMVIGQPKLLIADEPSSGLDALVKQDILRLLDSLHQSYQMAILIITHDTALVDAFCDEAIIINQGVLVEHSPVHALAQSPHAYTQRLRRHWHG